MNMAKTCNNCGDTKTPTSIPYAAHQGIVATMERVNKRLWITLVILVFLLVGSNIGWLVYESQFETVESVEEYEIVQDAEGGNNNSVINGGEIVNGETND